MHNTNAFYSDAQLAVHYQVSRATIWRWAADDASDFPSPVKISAGCTRWSREAIERFDADRAAGNTAQSPAQRARDEIEGDKPTSAQTAAPTSQQRRATKLKPSTPAKKQSRRRTG